LVGVGENRAIERDHKQQDEEPGKQPNPVNQRSA
jgi:hypothetical protein